MVEPSPSASETQRARVWLSRGLSELFDQHYRAVERGERTGSPHFDVVIVGSGYGGSVAAAMLAGCQTSAGTDAPVRDLSVAVLERGDEYLPGAFPSQLSELPGHVRLSVPGDASPWGNRWALFDVRVGPDVVGVVANGLGGGSLINAGVMLAPKEHVLAEAAWPSAIRSSPACLTPFFKRARQWLGAGTDDQQNTVGMPLRKLAAMQKLGARPVPITVALTPGARSTAGVAMSPCVACGDCATGCNHGAKESLDVNLLVHARRGNVKIYTGATVLRVARRAPHGWCVVMTHTDRALRVRQATPLRITADKLILAAGTFGSTEILMRSRERGLQVSDRLGHRFSANGDLLAAAYETSADVTAVANEAVWPAQRHVGPTITAAVDHREGHPDTDLSIQDLTVPGPLRRVFEEMFTSARMLHALPQFDRRRHREGDPDPSAVNPAAVDRTLPLALISRDAADGELHLVHDPRADIDAEGDGAVQVRWPALAHDPRFDGHHAFVQERLEQSGVGGRLLPNPAWKLLPDDAAQILGLERGPLLTVHPLGGCAMADDARAGVVNEFGQVFTADPGQPPHAVYDDLVVLDGSIIPTSLGINPALTITAVAIRAVEELRKQWSLSGGCSAGAPLPADGDPQWRRRPVFRTVPTGAEAPPMPAPPATMVQVIERLRGTVRLADWRRHDVELTLHSEPVAVADLMSRTGPRLIRYDDRLSTLRVLQPERARRGRPPEDPVVEARARVAGSLDVFRLAGPGPAVRTARALFAWFLHRGLRDTVQMLAAMSAAPKAPRDPMKPRPTAWQHVRQILAMASHAGARRVFDYDLRVDGLRIEEAGRRWWFGFGALLWRSSFRVHGRKLFTYDGRLSPWLQLMEFDLDRFPGRRWGRSRVALDLPYLVRQGVPLIRVVSQRDHVHALLDLASFCLYGLRTAVDTHLWSFRRPDRPPERHVNRLPGATLDLPSPQVIELNVTVEPITGKPVPIRLARYRPPDANGLPPVLLIHGYSASGTTFAHPTLRPGLAGHLYARGRDVWVLDLRSSAGMPWARHPWTFEEIGCEDIPFAVDHIVKVCGGKVDVVAHCMGAAMLCMALLGDIAKDRKNGERYPVLRSLLRERIRRIVLSQVGPVLIMSPTNQARAFVMRWVRQVAPMGDYEFRPQGDGSLADMLLDRLVATLPYPPDEYRRENPFLPPGKPTPWVRTRRRMDALYGQVFKLTNMSDETLAHLDDFFGPMNVTSVSQAIHFSRSRAITDAKGRHVFATPDRLPLLRRYPILSLHATENGLVDVGTADLLTQALRPAGDTQPLCPARHEARRLEGYGHQDSLIGRNPHDVFDLVSTFLANPQP